ncbi:MAG: hypothetical protein EXR78_03825 [Deltaproteobacteria bacterium]|nr:hypothetical protein [Deltaproteobacteria bacterium]
MSKQSRRAKRISPEKQREALATGGPQVDVLLEAGKTHDAVELAKQLLKQAPSPEAEALVVKAYQARLQALIASGLQKEAHALGQLVIERFPAHQKMIHALLRHSELLAENFQKLLTDLLTAEGERRRELETLLTCRLIDPGMLVRSTVLPAEHPLKRAAMIASELFTAVTSGPLPEGALLPLNEIPRQSPLAPWKLLIRAFDAFYRRNDAAVLANLAGIAPDAAPARLVPVLHRLMGATQPNAAPDETTNSFAVTTVVNRVCGNRAVVQANLSQLSRVLSARQEKQALASVQALLPLFRAAPIAQWRTFLATLLHHWHKHGLQPDGLFRVLPNSRTDPDILRLVALALERVAWEEALDWWSSYVSVAQTKGVLAPHGPDIARVWLRMAALFPADPLEVLDMFDAESEEDLRDQIRSGELPTHYDRERLLKQAHAADPSAQTFRALVTHYDRWGNSKHAETEAEAWRQAQPRELEPLLHLIRAAERRGASRKALELLAQAETLNRLHPDVRQSRFRLLLASAERRVREGKVSLALEDLAQLAQEPRAAEGEVKAYLFALSWASALKAGNSEGAARLERGFRSMVANGVLGDVVIDALTESVKVKFPRQTTTPSPEEAIDGLVRAYTLFQGVDRPLPKPETKVLTQIEKNLSRASLSQLHALCQSGLLMGRPTLTYLAAGHGLTQEGPLQHRFLLARGQTLLSSHGFQQQTRARRCLQAARELASRARDLDAVREASQALERLPREDLFGSMLGLPLGPPSEEAAPTPEDIAVTLNVERGSPHAPRFFTTKSARSSRAKKPKRNRGGLEMLEDLLSFLAPGKSW